jgi:hypothetical protein
VCGSVPAPTARDGQKNFRGLGHEFSLPFRREHEVAIAFALMSQCGEDAAANSEIGGAHM